MVLYFLSAVIWSYLLTKLDISFVQPILALTYVATPVLAIIFLGEQVPLMRWVGISIIILGVFVVARSSL
jgi:drug/metabolite transporter (DMT)-like permease